jgi:uncharacterized membrane protein YfcA
VTAHYLQIALAGLIAGTLDTVAGFGGSLLLLPVLVLIGGSKDAVLLAAIIPFGWNIPRLILLRGVINWRATGLFALGILPGALIGGHYLEAIDPAILRVGIGLLLILFGAYYVLRLYIDIPEPRGVSPTWFPIIGLISGFVGGVLGAGHGPIQIGGLASSSMSVREVAATGGALGALTGIARLVGYTASGALHQGLIVPGLVGMAAACGGTFLGIRVSKRSKDSTLELLIGTAMVIAGIRMVL